ncbi:hypothetical protein PR202_ga20550 [Eleusine coracana subsp. coracana]|uniref:CCHC-type domain-containing protein n=1 Tax=Eleusine coracana subsp. coracana TaxID=191504 RepID=A0AAV5CYM2_ELECO|nr:hypothetical protein PR202_ga20550 [Eleusine coracana subsp. coracana]
MPVATPAPAATSISSSPKAPRSISSLSPEARPFVPTGRSKSQRWERSPSVSSDGEASPIRPSYHDVVATLAAQDKSRQPPQTAKAPRIVLRSEIDHCTLWRGQPDRDGWQKVVSKRTRRHAAAVARRPLREVPADLRGWCFNCFSSLHRAADYRRHTRCFRCLEAGHRSYNCPRSFVTSRQPRSTKAVKMQWRPVKITTGATAIGLGAEILVSIPVVMSRRGQLPTAIYYRRFRRPCAAALPAAVEVELHRVPAHAWEKATAQHLLKDSCWVHSLHPDTENRHDLSIFWLSAWCLRSELIHAGVDLFISEPFEALAEAPPRKWCLSYPISIVIGGGGTGSSPVPAFVRKWPRVAAPPATSPSTPPRESPPSPTGTTSQQSVQSRLGPLPSHSGHVAIADTPTAHEASPITIDAALGMPATSGSPQPIGTPKSAPVTQAIMKSMQSAAIKFGATEGNPMISSPALEDPQPELVFESLSIAESPRAKATVSDGDGVSHQAPLPLSVESVEAPENAESGATTVPSPLQSNVRAPEPGSATKKQASPLANHSEGAEGAANAEGSQLQDPSPTTHLGNTAPPIGQSTEVPTQALVQTPVLQVYSHRRGKVAVGQQAREQEQEQMQLTPSSNLLTPRDLFLSKVSKAVGMVLPALKINKRSRVDPFPVPLSIKKLTKVQIQPLIDQLADLPGWKAELMTKAGRVVQVQFIMVATIIYHAMALDLPPWAIKAMEKIMRNYI